MGHYTVAGAHTYSANGTYTVTTIVTDVYGSTTTCTGTLHMSQSSTVTITPATGLSGTINTAPAASPSPPSPAPAPAPESPSTWGDGTSATSGTITGSSSPYTIKGSHTYSANGTYEIIMNLTVMMSHYYAAATITVGDGTLSLTGTSVSATAGSRSTPSRWPPSPTPIAGPPVTMFTALVNWGDSTPPTAAYVAGSSGSFSITGGHLYASTGTYTAVITLTDVTGTTKTASDSVTVSAGRDAHGQRGLGHEGLFLQRQRRRLHAGFRDRRTYLRRHPGLGDGAVAYGTLRPTARAATTSAARTPTPPPQAAIIPRASPSRYSIPTPAPWPPAAPRP